jgi:diguanylate cyclase (GGDEF)-like protein
MTAVTRRAPKQSLPSWVARLFLACLTLLAASASLAAEPVRVAEQARIDIRANQLHVLEDRDGRLDIETVADPQARSRFRSAGTGSTEANFGYSRSSFWLALDLDVAAGARPDWLLEIDYPSLDLAEVFVPAAAGGYARLKASDLQAFASRPFPHRNFVFPVTLQPGRTSTVFLRVQSEGTLTVPLTLWQPQALHVRDQQSYSILSLYYGLLLGLFAYNLLLWLSTRDTVFLDYVVFAACMAVAQLSLNGFGNQFLWPDWPQWGNATLPASNAATGLFGTLFMRRFLDTRRDFPRLDRALLVMAAVFLLAALSVMIDYRFAATLTTMSGMCFSVLAVGGAWYCMIKGHPGARWFVLAYTLLFLGVGILTLRNFGWLPTNGFTIHAMQIGSALEMLLLSFALADRMNVLRREKERASAEALQAKQDLVETLRRSEHDLEQRVEERTRDLETANQALQQKKEELQYLVQHDALTGLANRTLLEDRLTQALVRARRNGHAVAVLMADLDGFKQINDEHGHEAGDQMLKAIAMRLRACVRESDTVARIGGDEFIIVLDELQELGDCVRVAEKLVEVSSWPVHLAERPLQVSISVGIACFPRDATEQSSLVKLADDTMYQAKSAGRNCWASASQL